MALEDYYMISQVVAALAVIGSLVFVGMQMRQSDKTQRAIMHQERTHRQIEVLSKSLEPHNYTVLARSRSEDQVRNLTREDRAHLFNLLRMNLLSAEETLWQYRQNLLDEDVLYDQQQILSRLLSLPVNNALWQRSRDAYAEDFKAFVDEIADSAHIQTTVREIDPEWEAILDHLYSKSGQ